MSSAGVKPDTGCGIDVTSVAFSYGPRVVLQDITFSVPRNQVWALMGRSGIGKTTLLNIVLGLFHADSGTVRTARGFVNGPGSIRGTLFTEDSLLWWLSVLENLLFPEHGRASPEARERASRLLAAASLADAAGLHPKQLSAGMARRIGLLRALLMDDEYFVADEPFAALDVHTRLAIYGLWRDLRATHPRTGLICTHDPYEAALLCDAALVLREDAHGVSRIELLELPATPRGQELQIGLAHADPLIGELLTRLR